MKEPKSEIRDERLEPVETFEGLMPYPKKKQKPEESTEASVRPLDIDSEASIAKGISTEPEVVETDSEDRIKSRERAHISKLLRR